MAPTDKSKLKRPPTEKQPKASVARYLKSVEAKVHEGTKNSLLMKGLVCSSLMLDVLKDLRALKAPDAKLLQKNNDLNVFADGSSIEFLCTKNDCSTFAIGSNNKKRPDNLILGRTFDNQLLDLVELGVTNFRSLKSYAGAPKKRLGSKPMFLFTGSNFVNDDKYKKLQNLILDWFRGEPVATLALAGLDHVIVVTAVDDVVHFRTYHVKLKKNPVGGGAAPIPLLTNSGPDMDLTIRRTQFASADMWKTAVKQPKELKRKKVKNIKTNAMGETVGKIHLEKQDISEVKLKKSKALRIAEINEKKEEEMEIEEELKREKAEERKEQEATFGFDEGDVEENEEAELKEKKSKKRRKA
jgi:ribosome production factor 2